MLPWERTDLDGATLGAWSRCPWRGAWLEKHPPIPSAAMASGSEAHRLIAEAIGQYVIERWPVADYLKQELSKARPDLAADVADAIRPSIYHLDKFMAARNPADVLAYQGGQGERSGQFAWEFAPGMMATSEVDLLLATPAKSVLYEVDFKSGHTIYGVQDVRDAFQFRLHSWLLFHNFPDLMELEVSVWHTRLNMLTPPVTFRRKDLEAMDGALAEVSRHRAMPEPETWPTVEKCPGCPALLSCPAGQIAPLPGESLALAPSNYAQASLAMQAALDERLRLLREHVEGYGDIIWKGGAFGLGPPKRASKPRADAFKFYGEK